MKTKLTALKTTHSNIAHLAGGIYTLPDVSMILRLPLRRVKRWLNEYWEADFSQTSKIKYSFGVGGDRAINFYTLIEFYAFYELRSRGFSSSKISAVHGLISKVLKTPYPFANSKLLTDPKAKLVIFHNQNDDIISADKKLQTHIKEAVSLVFKKIEFGSDRLPERFWPIGKNKKVVIDPHHQFGQPIVYGTNIKAVTIYQMNKAGDSMDFIAGLYNINKSQVRDAIAFFKGAA
jgi:uncharacterized protein (DUF433 family)